MPPDRHQMLVNNLIQNKKGGKGQMNIIVLKQGTASGKCVHKLYKAMGQ